MALFESLYLPGYTYSYSQHTVIAACSYNNWIVSLVFALSGVDGTQFPPRYHYDEYPQINILCTVDIARPRPGRSLVKESVEGFFKAETDNSYGNDTYVL